MQIKEFLYLLKYITCSFRNYFYRARIKGFSATNATKPATTETGAKINVPLFINEGDKIKIDKKKSYIEE